MVRPVASSLAMVAGAGYITQHADTKHIASLEVGPGYYLLDFLLSEICFHFYRFSSLFHISTFDMTH